MARAAKEAVDSLYLKENDVRVRRAYTYCRLIEGLTTFKECFRHRLEMNREHSPESLFV